MRRFLFKEESSSVLLAICHYKSICLPCFWWFWWYVRVQAYSLLAKVLSNFFFNASNVIPFLDWVGVQRVQTRFAENQLLQWRYDLVLPWLIPASVCLSSVPHNLVLHTKALMTFSKHPPIHPSIHPFFHPSIHPSIHPSVFPRIQSSVHHPFSPPYICPWIHPFIHPSIHPFLRLSIQSSIHPSIHVSIHPFSKLSSHPSIHPSVNSSIHLFIHLSIIYPPIHPSTYPSIHLFIHLPIHLSPRPSNCPSLPSSLSLSLHPGCSQSVQKVDCSGQEFNQRRGVAFFPSARVCIRLPAGTCVSKGGFKNLHQCRCV